MSSGAQLRQIPPPNAFITSTLGLQGPPRMRNFHGAPPGWLPWGWQTGVVWESRRRRCRRCLCVRGWQKMVSAVGGQRWVRRQSGEGRGWQS